MGTIDVVDPIAVALAASASLQEPALWTTIDLSIVIEGEVREGEGPLLYRRRFEALPINKTRVAAAEINIGDVGIEKLLLAEDQVGMAEIIAVSGEGLALEIVGTLSQIEHILLSADQHGHQILMVLRGERLGMQDHLVLLINQCLSVVALNDAMRGRHLGRLVVGDIALDLFGTFAGLGFLILEEVIEALDLMEQTLFLLLAAFLVAGEGTVLMEVLGEDLFELLLKFVAFAFQILKGAAPFLGRIGGEFETVEAEVCAAQETQCIADQQDVAEDSLDFTLHGGDEVGDGAVVGLISAAERHEEDVLMAGAFDGAGADHAA